MVWATRGQHHCPILIHYRPAQTCFVNGRCRHTRFSLGRIDAGAPEESSNGYIVGNKNPSQAWRTDEEGIFFSSCNLWAARGSYRKHPCSPVLRPEDTAWNVHRGLGLLFQFLGMMDYFLCLLLSPAMHLSRQPCILASTQIWQIWMYMFIFMGSDIKMGGVGGLRRGLSQHFAVPWRLLYL